MPADLEEKTDRYETLLAEALTAAEIAPPEGTPLHRAARDCEEMARAARYNGVPSGGAISAAANASARSVS